MICPPRRSCQEWIDQGEFPENQGPLSKEEEVSKDRGQGRKKETDPLDGLVQPLGPSLSVGLAKCPNSNLTRETKHGYIGSVPGTPYL